MASKYIDLFPIPTGFPEIIHDFAKELIRCQPKDIYDFGIEYFKALENKTKLNYPIEDETEKIKEEKRMVIVNNPRQLDQMDQGRFNTSMDKYDQIKQFEENQKILAEQRKVQAQSHQTSRNVSGFVGEVIVNSSERLVGEIKDKQMRDQEREMLGEENYEDYPNGGENEENEQEQKKEEYEQHNKDNNNKLSHQSSNLEKAENFIDDVIKTSIENSEATEKEKGENK